MFSSFHVHPRLYAFKFHHMFMWCWWKSTSILLLQYGFGHIVLLPPSNVWIWRCRLLITFGWVAYYTKWVRWSSNASAISAKAFIGSVNAYSSTYFSTTCFSSFEYVGTIVCVYCWHCCYSECIKKRCTSFFVHIRQKSMHSSVKAICFKWWLLFLVTSFLNGMAPMWATNAQVHEWLSTWLVDSSWVYVDTSWTSSYNSSLTNAYVWTCYLVSSF